MTTNETGGLIGLVSRLISGAKSGVATGATAAKHSSLFDPLKWIVRLVLFAGFALILKKARANPDPTDAAVVLALGTAALMAEFYMGGEMVRGWFERSLTKVGSALAVYIAVLGYAALQWTGTAAEMEASKTGLQKASFEMAQSSKADADGLRSELNRARNSAEDIRKERWRPLPTVGDKTISSANEAVAIIDKLKTNTRFWTLTEGCKVTKGKDTRAYCSEMKEAEAAIAASQTREELAPSLKRAEDEVKRLEGEYKTANAKKEAAPQDVVSEHRADLRFLIKYANMSEETAQDLSAAWKIVIISFLACILGMMIKAREYRDMPKKPWGLASQFAALLNWVSRVLTGKNVVSHTTINKLDGTVYTRSDVNPLNVIGTRIAT